MKTFASFGAAVLVLGLASSAAEAASIIVNGASRPARPRALRAYGAGAFNGWTIERGSIDHIGNYWQARNGVRRASTSPAVLPARFRRRSPPRIGTKYFVSFDSPAIRTPATRQVDCISHDRCVSGSHRPPSLRTSSRPARIAQSWAGSTFVLLLRCRQCRLPIDPVPSGAWTGRPLWHGPRQRLGLGGPAAGGPAALRRRPRGLRRLRAPAPEARRSLTEPGKLARPYGSQTGEAQDDRQNSPGLAHGVPGPGGFRGRCLRHDHQCKLLDADRPRRICPPGSTS